jgi:glutamate racemase
LRQAIGVFDSGLGGLTAVKELCSCLPNEDIIYFGDTGRVPYGTRSKETIIKYAEQDIRFLMTFPIKAVLVACGTVSSLALEEIRGNFPMPMLGVVEGAVEAAAKLASHKRVAIIGTPGTISSGAYERAIESIDPEITVKSVACPLFVPLVENGRFHPGDAVIETVAREYLSPILDFQPDALILGCTHYPLLKEVIASIMGPGTALIDAGAEAAHRMKALLRQKNQLEAGKEKGSLRIFVSDNIYNFSTQADIFLQQPIEEIVGKIEIEKY